MNDNAATTSATEPPAPSAADIATLRDALDRVFAPWVGELHLQVLQAQSGQITLALPVAAQHVHVGGVLCGQTMMAACDTATCALL